MARLIPQLNEIERPDSAVASCTLPLLLFPSALVAPRRSNSGLNLAPKSVMPLHLALAHRLEQFESRLAWFVPEAGPSQHALLIEAFQFGL